MTLQAAVWPRDRKNEAALLVVQREGGGLEAKTLADLPLLLKEKDLLILNDAATLPASFSAKTEEGDTLELRLLSQVFNGEWRAALLGSGDWRQRTEDRPSPPPPFLGQNLLLSSSLQARITGLSDLSPRLVQIRFSSSGAELLRGLYAWGRPVQYSYLKAPLPLWQVQSAFASRPWSMEMPSAGAALPLSLLMELRRAGMGIAAVTHACGLSSVGEKILDEALPLDERYEIPEETVDLIRETRKTKGRIMAVGTSVMRALEGSFLHHGGFLKAGGGVTELLIGPGYVPKLVQGLLTGLHEFGESHHRLAASLLPETALARVLKMAEDRGLKSHEFGDLCLIL